MSRFRRRLMTLEQQRKAFADDYIPCEYIENVSTAYINSGIYTATTASSFRIEADIMQTQEAPSSGMAIFGRKEKNYTSVASGNRGFVYYIKYNSTDNFVSELQRTTNVLSTVTPELNKLYHISGNIKTMSVTFDEYNEETGEYERKTYSHTNAGSSMTVETHPIYIFNTYQPTVNNNLAFRGRMYSFKITVANKLVRDFVPMYRVSTDEYGFYDNVNKKFYGSANATKFTGSMKFVNDDIRDMVVTLCGTNDSVTYAQMKSKIPTPNIVTFCKENLQWVNLPSNFDTSIKIYGIQSNSTQRQADATVNFNYNGTTNWLGLYLFYKRWGYPNGSSGSYNGITSIWHSYDGKYLTFGKDSISAARNIEYFKYKNVTGYRPAQYTASMIEVLVKADDIN